MAAWLLSAVTVTVTVTVPQAGSDVELMTLSDIEVEGAV